MNHFIHHSGKEPEAPSGFKATDSGPTQVTLEWTEPELTTEGGLTYTVSLIKVFCVFSGKCKKNSEKARIFLLFIANIFSRAIGLITSLDGYVNQNQDSRMLYE